MSDDVRTVAVSACLFGENCKYNGGNNKNEELIEWLKDKKVIPVCPEVMGGLSTPRLPSEIVKGVVTNTAGENVHENFVKGAEVALSTIEENDVNLVILQSRSPSCGVKEIYDGTFSGNRIKGQGIFAKMLMERGYKVLDVEDFS